MWQRYSSISSTLMQQSQSVNSSTTNDRRTVGLVVVVWSLRHVALDRTPALVITRHSLAHLLIGSVGRSVRQSAVSAAHSSLLLLLLLLGATSRDVTTEWLSHSAYWITCSGSVVQDIEWRISWNEDSESLLLDSRGKSAASVHDRRLSLA